MIDVETEASIRETAIVQAGQFYEPDLSDEDLDSLVWDLEIDSAVAHGFDIHEDEGAAVAAQDIYREAFLAAVGRNLDALYRQKQQAHAAKYGL
jgi:hypothetical protein